MSDDIAKRLLAVRAFLAGQNARGGMWFGEDHPEIKGHFWWRQVHLPVLDEAAAEMTRLRARCDAADKLAEAGRDAREMILHFVHARWSEAEGSDEDYVGELTAALSAYEEAAK